MHYISRFKNTTIVFNDLQPFYTSKLFLGDEVGKTSLHFLRTKEKKEIDFLVAVESIPKLLVEVKWSDDTISKNFQIFDKQLSRYNLKKVQLVANANYEKESKEGVLVKSAADWLEKLDLS